MGRSRGPWSEAPPEVGHRGCPHLPGADSARGAPSGTGGEGAPPLKGFPLWAPEPRSFQCRPQAERFEVAELPVPPPQRGAAPAVSAPRQWPTLCMGMGPVAPPGHSGNSSPGTPGPGAAPGEFPSGDPTPRSLGLAPQTSGLRAGQSETPLVPLEEVAWAGPKHRGGSLGWGMRGPAFNENSTGHFGNVFVPVFKNRADL